MPNLTFIVYDFGGGTLDVSILYVSQGSVEVYATDGDNFLGGSDFDMCLHDHIRSRVFEQTDGAVWLDSLNSTNLGHGNPSEELSKDSVLGCNSAAIRKDIENLKKQLSMEFIVTFQCVYDHGKSNKHIISLDVSRTDFEMSCEHLFNRSLIPVNRILDDLGMVGLNIEEVVLVGGTTRIPLVKQKLQAVFSKHLNDDIDPDITIAYGASSILT